MTTEQTGGEDIKDTGLPDDDNLGSSMSVPGAPNADQVLAYLMDNPDFFTQHEQVIAELAISQETGGATSLLERQVLTLRDRNRQLAEQVHHQQRRADEQLAELVTIARGNEKQAQQLYNFAVKIIACLQTAPESGSLQQDALDYLQQQYSLSVASLVTVPDEKTATTAREKVLCNLMRYGTPVCVPGDSEEVQAVFSEAELTRVQSAAIVPIRRQENSTVGAILALGSDEAMRFHSQLGTQFLRELGKLISPIL